MTWCELHCHSAYSLLDGTSLPDDLADRAAELGYPALALTDHDSLAGIVQHALACAAVGVRPIAGCEITLAEHIGAAPHQDLPTNQRRISPPTPHTERRHLSHHQGQAALESGAVRDDGDGACWPVSYHQAQAVLARGTGYISHTGYTGDTLAPATRTANHLTLLARDAWGYRSLPQIISQAQLAGQKGTPQITLDELAPYAVDLECLTGCRQGVIAQSLLREDEVQARASLETLCDIFGRVHVWMEVQRPGLPDDGRLVFAQGQLARRAGIGLVATGNTHYALSTDRPLQDVLVCIKQRVPLTQVRPYLRSGASWHLRSPDEMVRRFVDLPAALRGVESLVARCHFSLDMIDAALPTFAVPEGETPTTYLNTLVQQGATLRYGSPLPATVQQHLTHELSVIVQRDLAGYFLIVWDIVRFAQEQGILCQGRGSAVGSVVCYCLGITAVEPLAHHLSFERFLNPDRADWPDIDLDLPADRDDRTPAREAVIQYVLRRYQGHAALVANTITFGTRSARRDLAMVLGLQPEVVTALSQQSDTPACTSGPNATEDTPELDIVSQQPEQRASTSGRTQSDQEALTDPIRHMLDDLCTRLVGLPRHLGQHPGGLVLTRRPLAQVAPLERARMPNRVIVQWNKDGVEGAGLVKIDLLGLGMLGAIERCFALIEQQTGIRPPLHSFRCDDPAVYDLVCAGDTVGVFQVESRAQISACLPQLQPRCYEDLIVAVAIIRPGPIQGGAVHPYFRRRRGEEPITYPGGEAGRRLLEPILGETLGVCLYQDQVIRLGVACGLSAGEADVLRRAMGSGRGATRMRVLRERLVAGLAAHGLSPEAQATVLGMMEAFSSYGFVKGHAAAFAYLAYISCWLKVYHPAAFYAALLAMQPMGFYPGETLIQDGQRHGIAFLPVDVCHSAVETTLTPTGEVRLGLQQIKGLSGDVAQRIVAVMSETSAASRAARPLTSEELCRRAELTAEEVRLLARAGALGGFFSSRRQALWQAPPLAALMQQTRVRGTPALPHLLSEADPPVHLPIASPAEDAALDRAALGLSLGGHPLLHLRPLLAQQPRRLVRIADLESLPERLVVHLVGQVISYQRPPSAHGVWFLGLSDESGLVNVVVLPAIAQRDRRVLHGERLVWICGVIERPRLANKQPSLHHSLQNHRAKEGSQRDIAWPEQDAGDCVQSVGIPWYITPQAQQLVGRRHPGPVTILAKYVRPLSNLLL